jgi:curved DNA-binding protein CbpA
LEDSIVMEPDPYATLGVAPTAPSEIISAAYRRLARIYHPDGRVQDPGRMIEINRAYDRIKTPELRRQHDEGRFVAVGPGRTNGEPSRWRPGAAHHATATATPPRTLSRTRLTPAQPLDTRPEWVRRAMAGSLRAKEFAG